MLGSGRGVQVALEWVVAIDCGCSACYELFFLTILARVVGGGHRFLVEQQHRPCNFHLSAVVTY